MPNTFASPYLQTQPSNPYLPGGNSGFLPNAGAGNRYSGTAKGFAVFDTAKRMYVDPGTGNPWTGPIVNAAGQTVAYANLGVYSPTPPATPGALPKPDFNRIPLYPETLGPARAIASTVGTGSSLDFSKMMKDLDTGHKAASDTALKSYGTAGLETEVRGLQSANETAQGDVLSKFSDSNARYTQETKDSLARLTAQLDKTEANIRAQAGAASSLAGSVARFPGVGGGDTITANNAGLAPRIARATYLPQLAAEERIGNLRYGQIANIEMPADQRLYQNDQGLLTFTAALNDKFRGDRFQIASFLNDVKTRMAAMPLQLQENYANYVLKLIGGEQAIVAGQLSNLSAAQRLIAASEYLQRDIPEPAVAGLNSYPVSSPNMGGTVRQQPNVTLEDMVRLLAQQRGQPAVASPVTAPASYPSRVNPGIPGYTSGPASTGGGMLNGRWFGNDALGNPYVNTPNGGVSVNPDSYPLDYFN